MAPKPIPLPSVSIPPSDKTVRVRIIDSTARIAGIPATRLFEPAVKGFTEFWGPAYSFLIEHEPSGQKALFDLGVRTDMENLAATIRERMANWKVEVKQSVSEILSAHSVPLESINAIIWSHRHWDHTGDPALFPSSTDLVVGPGFRDFVGPGYPEKEDSPCTSSAWEGRNLVELDFEKDHRACKVGRYHAIDWFEDGSFYLLQTRGHTFDHICGFARTKLAQHSSTGKDEFMLMGGDIAHHGGEYRPTKYIPIPDNISPDPRLPPFHGGICPGEFFTQHNSRFDPIDPSNAHNLFSPSKPADAEDAENLRYTTPFLGLAKNFPDNLEEARWSLEVLEEFDGQDNIFVVFAHDETLLDILDFFPLEADTWREKGWKREGHWRFLNSFGGEK